MLKKDPKLRPEAELLFNDAKVLRSVRNLLEKLVDDLQIKDD